jgi:glycosyltransferase involved in cell wall biosynthesis
MKEATQRIAVLLPCYNEAATIGKVVREFRRELPEATIYVFDNNSTDGTAMIAHEAGAVVLFEPRQGKGHVIERMFSQVQADYYLMADGDDTYPTDRARELLEPVISGRADMAVGARLSIHEEHSFRPLHVFGNRLVRWLINVIFATKLTDILSGYRAFNQRVVSRVPIVSSGFEVETEMTVNCLYYGLTLVEIQLPYGSRAEDNPSKLRTISDGSRVLLKLFQLFRTFKPLTFFGVAALLLFALGLTAGIPPVYGFAATGKVDRFPLAILATGLMILSAGTLFLGIVLHAMNWRFKELHNVLTRSPAGETNGSQHADKGREEQ